MAQEIRSVFNGPMGGKQDFKFLFLQSPGGGTKVLTIPAVSNTFTWTAQQVAKLGGYKLPVYNLAHEPLTVSVDSDVSSVCHTVLLQIILCRRMFLIMKSSRLLLCQNQLWG